MRRVISILFALTLVLAFSLVATTPVGAATVYVPGGYATIQAAINAANPGDTIVVAAGTYDLTASIRVTKSVSIIGDISNPGNVVINAGTIPLNSGPKPPDADRDAFQVAANNVVIRGFKIVDAITVPPGTVPGDGWQNCGITVGGDITLIDWLDPWNKPILIDGGTFSDNIVQNCTNGIYLAMAKNVVVRNNVVRNCMSDRAGADGAGIMNWNTKYWGVGNYQDPTGNIIEGNLVENCGRIGICLGAWGEWFSVSGTVIKNNIFRNSQEVAGIQLLYIDGPLTITGNEISGNPEGIDISACTGLLVSCNNITGNTNWGMYNGGASLDARHNWWGDDSGPYHATLNPGGTGDKVSDNVDFNPWIGKPGSVWTATDTGYASFASSSGGVADLTAKDIPPSPPTTLPHGMFSFRICCLNPGDTVTLTVTLPTTVPAGSRWWKYQGGSWYSLPIGGGGTSTITVTFKDGGQGDADGKADGQIMDDGAPGDPQGVGWDTYPVSKMRVLLPWLALLAAFILAAGLLALRHRRTTT